MFSSPDQNSYVLFPQFSQLCQLGIAVADSRFSHHDLMVSTGLAWSSYVLCSESSKLNFQCYVTMLSQGDWGLLLSLSLQILAPCAAYSMKVPAFMLPVDPGMFSAPRSHFSSQPMALCQQGNLSLKSQQGNLLFRFSLIQVRVSQYFLSCDEPKFTWQWLDCINKISLSLSYPLCYRQVTNYVFTQEERVYYAMVHILHVVHAHL